MPDLTDKKLPTLYVVIVNTRTADLTIGCLESLDAEFKALPNLRVTVVDNDSGDGSEQRMRDCMTRLQWGERGRVLQAGRNGGFAAGNNVGIRDALASAHQPDYVLLLNPDTLALPNAFKELIDFMESRPDVGLAGTRMEYPDGSLQPSSFRFHSVLGEFERGVRLGVFSRLLRRYSVNIPLPNTPCQVDWVGGASFMIRRAVLDQVGLLDENFFVYYEETDYCLRARRLGWSSWYVPQSRFIHLEGQTTGLSDKKRLPKRRARYWFESRRRYFVMNHGPLVTFLADMAWVAGFATYRVREFVQRKPKQDPPHLLWDFVKYNFIRPTRVRR